MASRSSPSYPGSNLIEDWPGNRQDSEGAGDACADAGLMARGVQFSNSSVLYVYEEDPHHIKGKSFSSHETRSFRQDTIREAFRVKKILSSSSPPLDETGGCPIKRLEACDVPKEEALGLEHLVLEDDPSKVLKRRQLHLRAVLTEQANQDRQGVSDAVRLARLSAMITKRPTSQARNRAQLAAAS